MSEQQPAHNHPTEGAQPNAAQIPPMSPQQANQIKASLIQNFAKVYTDFMAKLNGFPAESVGAKNAVFYFDTGFVWFEKALANLPLLPVSPQPPQQPEPPQAPSEPQAPQAPESAPESPKDEPVAPNAA